MEIKEGVRNAIAFAKESLGSERTANIRLEEIESSIVNGRPVWLITLSSSIQPDGPVSATKALAAALGTLAEREYKVFTVAKDNGEVLSMKIRLLTTSAN